MRIVALLSCCVAAGIIAAGCRRTPAGVASTQPAASRPATGPTTPWTPRAADELSAAQAKQVERGAQARDALLKRLQEALAGAISGDDPAPAIGVCHEMAPRIATEVSREFGVRIGRTSYKLRNPNNAPPTWAIPYVDRRVDHPVHLVGPRGTVASLYPIKLKARCLLCHGAAEQIPPKIRQALAADYPSDRATGFKRGDLRGWFWVEVPAP